MQTGKELFEKYVLDRYHPSRLRVNGWDDNDFIHYTDWVLKQKQKEIKPVEVLSENGLVKIAEVTDMEVKENIDKAVLLLKYKDDLPKYWEKSYPASSVIKAMEEYAQQFKQTTL